MTVAIIGLGLIGGSMAKTIRLHTAHRVLGCDLDGETLRAALRAGAIHAEMTEQGLREADLVLVALYPGAIIRWITEHADCFKPGAVVIDCGGIKGRIVEALRPVAAGRPWHYIGGHPMAGREFSGFAYARDDLYDNASMILTPDPEEDGEVLRRVRDFFMDLGFRRVQITDPRTHDEMIAYTSQLAHIVSSAYVKCPLADRHRGFSAGSFADMTRVARLNEDMWTELFLDNREALLPEVEGLAERVSAYARALRERDRETLHTLLREGREIKEKLTEQEK